MEDETVVVPETTEEVNGETIETPEENEAPEVEAEIKTESVEELKARLAKAEEIANNYKIRSEKAEKVAKTVPSQDKVETISSGDLLAIMKADIHEDDMERVEKFAKMEGITIREALKNEELKAILDLRKENRNSLGAANISNVRRGPAKIPDDVLLSRAAAGKLPETDYDIQRLIAAKAKKG
jgi:hypothetical protein